MPWKASDAHRFTRKANTPARRRKWAAAANSAYERAKQEGKAKPEQHAIRVANWILLTGKVR